MSWAKRRTASRHWRSSRRRGPTCCCSTSACRASTASAFWETARRSLADAPHPRFAHLLPASRGEGARQEWLTEREIEVLRLLAAGNSNREIGTLLHLAEGTVKNHVSTILAKL